MKKFIYLSFVVLITSLFPFVVALGQCTIGEVALTTQEEVDDFGADLQGCTVLIGNIEIGSNWSDVDGLWNNSDITNLDALQGITSISENLEIIDNPLLTSLEGLGDLAEVSGWFWIEENVTLPNLAGLENLVSVGETFRMRNNNDLLSISALTSIEFVGGSFVIEDNPTLFNVAGLNNLSSIEGSLVFENNAQLTNVFNLNNLTTIGGSLVLRDNPQLANINSLSNVTEILGSLRINTNASLTNLNGLSSLSNIGGNLDIDYTPLQHIDGLENLTSVQGTVWLWNLNNIDGLIGLTTIGGELTMLYNYFDNIDGLSNLTSVGTDLDIKFNDYLTNIDGLSNLNSIEGNIIIDENDAINNLNGLSNLTNFNGNVFVADNPELTSINGLSNLTDVGRLIISNNDDLTTLDGLGGINNVYGDLGINYNYALTDINGLNNIDFVTGDLDIQTNFSLQTCCAVLGFINNVEGNISISNNDTGCEDLGEVILNCAFANVQANAFFDVNENELFDEGEENLFQTFSLFPSAKFAFSDSEGSAYFKLEEFGNYTLSLEEDPLWNLLGENSSVEIMYLDTNFADTSFYFPMQSVADFTIQGIDLTSSITRCNQNTNYWLSYTNKGTTVTDGVIELIPNDLTTFVSASPSVDSTADGKLYWFYENLYPTHSNQILLTYEMPSVEELGEMIDFEASIQTNEGFGDAKTTLSSELICAYDPNDKLNSPSGYGAENYTLFGDTLEYTIRFQNTGNDTAFTVVIRDQLSEYLDLNTFRPIASSHNVETQIDLNSRLATFTFNDIYLPDSFVNELASHGFVKYQILGNGNLDENTDLKNTANIFFDQNPPIVTNTTNNRMVSELPDLPVLSASPTDLNFGEIALDESAFLPQTLLISNAGELPLHIENFNFENNAFNSDNIQTLIVEGQSSVEVPIYFEPSEAGTYQSQLILESNVGTLSVTLNGTAFIATDIEAVTNLDFAIYPNPNEGLFTIQSERESIEFLRIQNSLGEIILEEKGITDFTQIDLTKQSKGLYFVIVKTAEGVFVEKVILQ